MEPRTLLSVVPTILDAPTSSPEGSVITLNSTVTEPGYSGPFTYLWSVTRNGSPYTVTGNTASTFSFTPDDNGNYAVTLTATDDQLRSGSTTAGMGITNVTPVITSFSPPATGTEGQGVGSGIYITDPGTADVVTCYWTATKDGQPWASYTGTATRIPPTFTDLATGWGFSTVDNGTYVMSVTVVDDDGGTATASGTIVVPNLPPTATITGAPASSPEGTAITLTANATDPSPADVLSYNWSVLKDGQTYPVTGNTSRTFTFTPDDNGTYVASVTVTDDDGGSVTTNVSISVTNVAPVITSFSPPATGVEGSGYGSSVMAFDPGTADPITFHWTATRNGQLFASSTTTGTRIPPTYKDIASGWGYGTPDDGTYVLTVQAADDDGGLSDPAIATTIVQNLPPTATISGAPASSPEGTPITLTCNASDPGPLDVLTYTWSVYKNGQPYAVTNNTSPTFTFTPNDNGTFQAVVIVSDGDGGIAVPSVSINVTNVAPVITSFSPTTSMDEGTGTGTSITIADPGTGDVITCYWSITRNGQAYSSGTSTASQVSPGTFVTGYGFGTPDDGTYVWNVTVLDDDGGSASTTRTTIVRNVAPTVTIVNPPSTGQIGQPITLTCTATDPGPLDVLTYSWTILKNGQPFAATGTTTATVTFTPDATATYSATVTVNDGDGGVGSANASISVGATADSTNYAVLFSGGYNQWNNHARYYNNIRNIYQLITTTYNVLPANVYVVYADGTNPAVDRSDGINSDMSFASGSTVLTATRANLQSTLTTLAGRADANDHFFFWSFDHGGDTSAPGDTTNNTGEYLNGWGETETIRDDELAPWLANINAGFSTSIHGQCFAGGMVDDMTIGAGEFAASATNHYEYSWGDGFVAAFYQALQNGLDTTHAAFEYAWRHDPYAYQGTYPADGGTYAYGYEHPWSIGADFPIFYTPNGVQAPGSNEPILPDPDPQPNIAEAAVAQQTPALESAGNTDAIVASAPVASTLFASTPLAVLAADDALLLN